MGSFLVAGGAGFLGSRLCERFLQDRCDVVRLDNLFTGAKNKIRRLIGDLRFEFIRHDVTFPINLEIDQIYDLACPASPIHYQSDPVQASKTNVHGAINLLIFNQVCRFCFEKCIGNLSVCSPGKQIKKGQTGGIRGSKLIERSRELGK